MTRRRPEATSVSYDTETLGRIYDRTSGYCHICGKKLSLTNYACPGEKGAWEVEHSVPQAKGGTNHLNNLFAGCIQCNRDKSDQHARTARGWHGSRRAPLSRHKRAKAKAQNAVLGGIIGGGIGAIFGPAGVVAGSTIGAAIGHGQNPDRK